MNSTVITTTSHQAIVTLLPTNTSTSLQPGRVDLPVQLACDHGGDLGRASHHLPRHQGWEQLVLWGGGPGGGRYMGCGDGDFCTEGRRLRVIVQCGVIGTAVSKSV